MATKYIVDTHTLVWFLEGNPRLGTNARTVLETPDSLLVIPVIVLAEACWLIEHGRISIPIIGDFLRAVDSDSRVVITPFDRALLDVTLDLSTIKEMHDRQIVATALRLMAQGESVVLLTKDANIRDSGLVSTVW